MTEPTREQLLEQIALNSETIANLGHHGRQFAGLLADANHRIAKAEQQVKVLEERIRKVREIFLDCAEASDGMCGYGQRALAVLDDSPHVSDSIKELTPDEEAEKSDAYDAGEVFHGLVPLGDSEDAITLTREEWEAAAKAHLDTLGLTYTELAQMNRDGVFKTHAHKVLWVLIGGTLDEEKP